MPDSGLVTAAVCVTAALAVYLGVRRSPGRWVGLALNTRAMSLETALVLAAILSFFGAFVSTSVARTVTSLLVKPEETTQLALLAGTLGALAVELAAGIRVLRLNTVVLFFGGIIGAVASQAGVSGLNVRGMAIVAGGMLLAPLVGYLAALLVAVVLFFVSYRSMPAKVARIFRGLQGVSVAVEALGRSSILVQVASGVIALSYSAGHQPTEVWIPWWAIILSALAVTLGTASSRRLPSKEDRLPNLQPIQAFSAEVSSGLVLTAAALTGIPVATSHVSEAAFSGVGDSRPLLIQRARVARQVAADWFLALPLSAAAGYLFAAIIARY